MNPRVSVVITTCRRPHLVSRAVHSALGQTLTEIEVIVVVDGPDPATTDTLALIHDKRLRVHVRAQCGGQAAAINTGIALARGEWSALLDDDDHWFPAKLERQLCTAEASVHANPIVTCRFLVRTESTGAIWPRRLPRPGEPVCEYMFCRSTWAFGEGILQTSTLFARTRLLQLLPMDETLARHPDLDWMLRADRRKDVGFEAPPGPEPLAVWEVQRGRDRLSLQRDWRYSLKWIQGVRGIVTARAYAGFVLTWVSSSARQQRDWSAFVALARRAIAEGSPNRMEWFVHLTIWIVPEALRVRVSRKFAPIETAIGTAPPSVTQGFDRF